MVELRLGWGFDNCRKEESGSLLMESTQTIRIVTLHMQETIVKVKVTNLIRQKCQYGPVDMSILAQSGPSHLACTQCGLSLCQ